MDAPAGSEEINAGNSQDRDTEYEYIYVEWVPLDRWYIL